MRYCNKCGKELQDHSKFCTCCGAKQSFAENPPTAAASQPAATAPTTAKPKRNRAVIWLSVIGCILLVSAVVLGILWLTSPEHRILSSLKSGNYDQALEIYEESEDIDESSILIASLSRRITQIRNGFDAKTIAYATAQMELETIQKMDLYELRGTLEEAIYYVNLINESRGNFSTAESFFLTGDYAEAIYYYSLVAKEDSNFDTAAAKYTESVTLYRQQKLAEASSLAGKEYYDQAASILRDALSILSNDTTIAEQLRLYEKQNLQLQKNQATTKAAQLAAAEDYLEAWLCISKIDGWESDLDLLSAANTYLELHIAQVISKADEKAALHDYDGAIILLEAAQLDLPETNTALQDQIAQYRKDQAAWQKAELLTTAASFAANGNYLSAWQSLEDLLNAYPSDLELVSVYNSYKAQYVSQTISQADAKVAKQDFDSALSILDTALKNVPSNESLLQKRDEVVSRMPVLLDSLTPINRSGWVWNTGTPVDPFGNDYSSASNYAVFSNYIYLYPYTDVTDYIEYRVYGNYSTLSLDISPQQNIDENGYAYVQIYADDKLIYESKIVRKMDQFTCTVDISGVEYIKIQVDLPSQYAADDCYVIISDAKLIP